MRRRVAHMSIMLAVIILFLHAFTPHRHITSYGNDSGEISIRQTCQFPFDNFLTRAFQYNPGAHHLEEYEVTQESALPVTTCVVLVNDLPLLPRAKEYVLPVPAYRVQSPVIHENASLAGLKGLRAPPLA